MKPLFQRIILSVSLLASLTRSVLILADDRNVVQTLSLAQLIQEALAENPEIKASEQRWLSAQAKISQVQTLPDPKVLLCQSSPKIDPLSSSKFNPLLIMVFPAG
jgi:hypothetical protein